MKFLKSLTILFILALIASCSSPEDKLLGTWEYESYEIDKSGIGTLASLLPSDWKKEIDKYIESAGNFTKGKYIFKEDGTYETAYSGVVEGFTKKEGNYSLSPDFKTLTLKSGTSENLVKLKSIDDMYFIELWELKDFSIPATIQLKYKKIANEAGK